jgi:hypothetical protein
MLLQETNAANAKTDRRGDEIAAAAAAQAPHEDAAQRLSKRRLEQLAVIWARQTGRKIVVA